MKTMQPGHSNKGFTLIEMLVVITIIVILAGLSVGGFNMVMTKQANSKAKIQVSLLSSALEEYKLDNGTYPESSGDTNPLYLALYKNGVDSPETEKIYLADFDPDNNPQGWINPTGGTIQIIDPWGRPYIYRNPPTENPDFDLMSLGKDGVEGTPDDIANF